VAVISFVVIGPVPVMSPEESLLAVRVASLVLELDDVLSGSTEVDAAVVELVEPVPVSISVSVAAMPVTHSPASPLPRPAA
jgi:hypothetical protein